jgi:PAS domain-containing protein
LNQPPPPVSRRDSTVADAAAEPIARSAATSMIGVFSRLRSRLAAASAPGSGSTSAPADTGADAGADAVLPDEPALDRTVPTCGLTGVLGSVDDLLFVLDEAGRFAAASGPLQNLLGAMEQDLIGGIAAELFAGAADPISNGTRGTVQFASADGTRYSAMLTVSLVEVTSDRAFRVGILTDVRERKAAAGRMPSARSFGTALRARLKVAEPPHMMSAGRIEVIGLAEVKAAMGDSWPEHATRAMSLARTVIERRLSVEDMFTQLENDSFLICFGTLSVREARVKAELLAQEIRQRLLGAEDTSSASFAIVSQADPVAVDAKTAAAEDVDLVKVLLTQLDAARAERQQAAAQKVTDLLTKATLGLAPVLTAAGVPTGVSIARIGGDQRAWRAAVDAADGDAKMLSELDALLLGLALKGIYKGLASGQAPATIVSVNYSTLRDRRFLQDYLSLCQKTDAAARSRILFEVHGLTPDVPQLRLQEVLSRLAPYSSHRILRAPNLDHRFVDLDRFRPGMVSIVASRKHPGCPRSARALEKFITALKGCGGFPAAGSGIGCKLLVRDARDEATARWYASHGADFISPAALPGHDATE